jgi:phage N-6-adenine-methyltransferase
MKAKSAIQVFATYGGKQHALAERKKRHRGQADAFPEMAGNEDPEGDERYTTRETLELCKRHAGVDKFDLDVAACAAASVAIRYYDKVQNGLRLPWFGRVWCNPPYSDIEPWVVKAWAELRARNVDVVAMLIPATRTEQSWWQREVEPKRDHFTSPLKTYFLPGRTPFARPGSMGVGQSGTPFGCVLLVWRRA